MTSWEGSAFYSVYNLDGLGGERLLRNASIVLVHRRLQHGTYCLARRDQLKTSKSALSIGITYSNNKRESPKTTPVDKESFCMQIESNSTSRRSYLVNQLSAHLSELMPLIRCARRIHVRGFWRGVDARNLRFCCIPVVVEHLPQSQDEKCIYHDTSLVKVNVALILACYIWVPDRSKKSGSSKIQSLPKVKSYRSYQWYL